MQQVHGHQAAVLLFSDSFEAFDDQLRMRSQQALLRSHSMSIAEVGEKIVPLKETKVENCFDVILL